MRLDTAGTVQGSTVVDEIDRADGRPTQGM